METQRTRTTPTDAEITDLLARMRETHDTYAALVTDYDEEATHRRPAPSEWSATETIAHIADLDQFNRTQRYNAILMEDAPTLPAYDPDASMAAGNYAAMSTTEVLALLKAERDAVLMLLEGLRPHEWARTGVHPRFGAGTLFDHVARTPGHDEAHVAQVRAALGAARA